MKRLIELLHARIYVAPLLFLALDAVLSTYTLLTNSSLPIAFPVFTAGIVTGWVSFLTGAMALFILRKNKMAAGLFFIHAFINSVALLVLTAFWVNDMRQYTRLNGSTTPSVLFKWLMLALLLTGIYLGKIITKSKLTP